MWEKTRMHVFILRLSLYTLWFRGNSVSVCHTLCQFTVCVLPHMRGTDPANMLVWSQNGSIITLYLTVSNDNISSYFSSLHGFQIFFSNFKATQGGRLKGKSELKNVKYGRVVQQEHPAGCPGVSPLKSRTQWNNIHVAPPLATMCPKAACVILVIPAAVNPPPPGNKTLVTARHTLELTRSHLPGECGVQS